MTIDYTYDPLYRLTAADYDSGEYFHYTYDAVGNRLTQQTQVGTNAYTYDDVNRLTEVDGVSYTWSANGNLLSDGESTYTYDHANRLSSVVQGEDTYNYTYNGLGDRLTQMVNGEAMNYTLDTVTGLTQVLDDGANAYLYGLDRVGEEQPAGWAYHIPDALGSVRQLTDADAGVTLARAYEPFGSVMASSGLGETSYSYTGEWADGTGLVHLRAREYSPLQGRFVTRDPSNMEKNLFLYSSANPINLKDPTGYMSGLEAFAYCFDYHSLTHGFKGSVSAQDAVDICRLAYSKDMWNRADFNFSGDLPTTGRDLFGWYIFEHRETHLKFPANEQLTKDLSISTLINDLRKDYYWREALNLNGNTPKDEYREYRYNLFENLRCGADSIRRGDIAISCVLGSFYYQVKTVDNGNSVGFRIDNRTDLESGTHIAGRFPPEYGRSVEELIESGYITGDEALINVVNKSFYGKQVISILQPRSRGDTSIYWQDGIHILGGGNLVQTYFWKEDRDSCPISAWLLYKFGWKKINIKPWPTYENVTIPIDIWE